MAGGIATRNNGTGAPGGTGTEAIDGGAVDMGGSGEWWNAGSDMTGRCPWTAQLTGAAKLYCGGPVAAGPLAVSSRPHLRSHDRLLGERRCPAGDGADGCSGLTAPAPAAW